MHPEPHRRSSWPRTGLGLALLFCLWTGLPALAANHALLVGIGAYARMGDLYGLEGPPNDVKVLRDVLKNHWGMPGQNIRVLLDQGAGKAAILSALKDLAHRTRPGDQILFYFSGHGTSANDPLNHSLGIDPTSGALIPADFYPGPDSKRMLAGLIVGSRDLRPILQRLERDRTVLAVFDTCYSGNTVRSLRSGPPLKRRSLDVNLDLENDLTGGDQIAYGTATIKSEPFPYTNVVYISASSKQEVAVDISAEHIQGGARTIDNLPHGAFTDQLLRGLTGSADTNQDGLLTIRELFHYTRDGVSRRYNQTPGLLFSENNQSLPDRALFSRPLDLQPITRPAGGSNTYRIRMKNVGPLLEKRLSILAGIEITRGPYDLLVHQEGHHVWLHHPGGHFLATLPANHVNDIVAYIKRQVKLDGLIKLATRENWPFNLFLSLTESGGVLQDGDRVGFEIRSEVTGYPLLLDIDPAGMINVIYPYYPRELKQHPAATPLLLKDISGVQAPFGMERLLAFWFKSKPAALSKMVGGEFTPKDHRFDALLKMFLEERGDVAGARLQVKTSP